MDALKPCPFCASQRILVTDASVPSLLGDTKYTVYCEACFCEGPSARTTEEAERRWNNREGAA